MTTVVFDLWFEREYEDRDDTQLHIGIYASKASALAAIERLKDKPGFRDFPAGFAIHPTTLDQDGWIDGFFSYREGEPATLTSEASVNRDGGPDLPPESDR